MPERGEAGWRWRWNTWRYTVACAWLDIFCGGLAKTGMPKPQSFGLPSDYLDRYWVDGSPR